MGRKCCVKDCFVGFKGHEEESKGVSIYRLPSAEKFPDERSKWEYNIPPRKDFVFNKDSCVSAKHWPPGFEKVSINGKLRPKFAPTVFSDEIPPSVYRTPKPPPRTTVRASCSQRNVEQDQLPDFHETDAVTFECLKDKLLSRKHDLIVPVLAFMDDDILVVQTRKLLNGVPLFIIRISSDQTFENYHLCNRVASNHD